MGDWKKWTLNDEQVYLDGLGSWSSNRRRPYGRIELLTNYIETLHLRRYETWLQEAWDYAKELLKEEST